MYTCVCAWSILNVTGFVIVYPVGVLEVPAEVWEPVPVCRHIKKTPKPKQTTKKPNPFSTSEIYAEIVTLLRSLIKGS